MRKSSPRSPRVLLGSLSLLLSVLAAPACSGGDAATTEPTPPVAPALDPTPPAGLSVEIWFAGGREALTGVRDQVRAEALRTMLPATMGELYERFAPLPENLRARVRDDAPLVAVRVEDAQVVAALATLDGGTSPFGATIPMVSGGPAGSRFVGRAPVPGEPFVVLYEDVLLMARDPAQLEAALGYLVSRVRSAELGAPGLHIRSAEGVIARRARTEMDAALDEYVAAALAQVRAERAARETPPTLGDPEAFIQTVSTALRGLTAYMPDVVSATVWVGPTAHGLGVTFETELTPGSPAARTLAALPEVPTAALGRLPQGTSIGGVLSPAPQDQGLLSALAEVGGGRVRPEDQAALAALSASQRERSGGVLMFSLGATEDGGFALLATPTGPGADPAALNGALATPYVRALLGDLLGCPNAEPRRNLALAARVPVCTRATPPVPALHHQADDTHSVLALTQTANDATVHPLPAVLFTDLAAPADASSPRALGSQPDVARALDSASPRVLSAWVVMPGHLGRAVGLLAFPAVRALGNALTQDTPPAPILVFVEREESGVRVRFSLTPGAFDQAAQAALFTSQLF
ncbi:MAG: hypothetical protein IPL19_28525 [Sandaracinaceae bacterium]|nr:hypothetical protein [Sandaracinaceae bacterium]